MSKEYVFPPKGTKYPIKPEQAVKSYGVPMICAGCAHSVGGGEKFPGRPSGERPCCFCVRNVEREQWHEDAKKKGHGLPLEWYDGSPMVNYPMDCYHSVDMKQQMQMWDTLAGKQHVHQSDLGGVVQHAATALEQVAKEQIVAAAWKAATLWDKFGPFDEDPEKPGEAAGCYSALDELVKSISLAESMGVTCPEVVEAKYNPPSLKAKYEWIKDQKDRVISCVYKYVQAHVNPKLHKGGADAARGELFKEFKILQQGWPGEETYTEPKLKQAWLVEKETPAKYLLLKTTEKGTAVLITTDPNDATQFPTKEQAEAAIKIYAALEPGWKAVEHGWY